MSLPARPVAAAPDLGTLEAITQAVEGGLGLPEVVRAAARALDASLVLIDRSSGVLAVAARSSADERSLMTDAPGVVSHELRVGDSVVGRLRLRGRSGEEPPAALLRVVTTLIASEVERLRAPERAPGSLAAVIPGVADSAGQVVLLVPEAQEHGVRRVAESIARELQSSLHGFTFAVGHSRVAHDPVDLYRAGNEALLAANVAETRPASIDEPSEVLAFEDTGAYRLLLPAMSEDPAELERFYTETVEPLVAYDAQYETQLVQTLETFLECDGNVAGTAQRLYTHRHTVRYRLERVRDLSGLDVSSTDGRERLGLGLKAMRVLGIASPRGPASEAGAAAGRVRRGPKDR